MSTRESTLDTLTNTSTQLPLPGTDRMELGFAVAMLTPGIMGTISNLAT